MKDRVEEYPEKSSPGHLQLLVEEMSQVLLHQVYDDGLHRQDVNQFQTVVPVSLSQTNQVRFYLFEFVAFGYCPADSVNNLGVLVLVVV